MHNHEVRVDLKVSRRESGLLQSDVAHLLGVTQPRISRLEHGKSPLTVEEAVKLTIICNKSVSKLFRLLSERLKYELASRLKTMPPDVPDIPHAEQRQKTLSQLSDQLADYHIQTHD